MIHKACVPVYIVIQIFLADIRTIQQEVVQEVLADLKNIIIIVNAVIHSLQRKFLNLSE